MKGIKEKLTMIRARLSLQKDGRQGVITPINSETELQEYIDTIYARKDIDYKHSPSTPEEAFDQVQKLGHTTISLSPYGGYTITAVRSGSTRESYIREAVDIKKIISDLKKSFSGSNEEQIKGVQLLRGLATSDEDLANKFMKELDQATTDIANRLVKEENTMRKVKEDREVIEIPEEFKVPGTDIILEKGDRIVINEMNRWEASKLDAKGEYYTEYDEDVDEWCVFGTESGFCYATFMSQREAEDYADEMNSR